MFCLRIWLLPLFFLSNASPLYLLLFLSATYFLQRPCVYCSLLLAILVFVLFDFQRDWFDPQQTTDPLDSPADHSSASTSFQGILCDAASLLGSAFNCTAGTLVDLAAQELQSKAEGRWSWPTLFGLEWARSVSGRRELRIPCVNAIIRL